MIKTSLNQKGAGNRTLYTRKGININEYTHRVVLANNRGYIDCCDAYLSKSGNRYVLVLSTCDCYKNACDCRQELHVPHYYVEEVIELENTK